jgi:hypothetical protein
MACHTATVNTTDAAVETVWLLKPESEACLADSVLKQDALLPQEVSSILNWAQT